jgi:polyphosphate glucokinase
VEYLGIDVGGSGIKGAPVNTETGELLAPRHRIRTPKPAQPEPMAAVVGEIAKFFQWNGGIGIGMPSVVRHGVIGSAANISKKWLGVNAEELFSQATGCPATVINDADAAGIAEMTFGAGRGRTGVVMIITIGTGLGSVIFVNGRMLPNTELGHIEIGGQEAEAFASDAARKREKLSWKKWGKRFNLYLNTLERWFSPDLFIMGGGISNEFDQFRPYLELMTEVVPAQLLNEAGIVGAALAAAGHGADVSTV